MRIYERTDIYKFTINRFYNKQDLTTNFDVIFRYLEDCYGYKRSEERKMSIIIFEISMENNLDVKFVKIYVKICNKIVKIIA